MKKQKFLLLLLLSLFVVQVKAQTVMTLEQSLETAIRQSPSLQTTLFTLQRTTETLNAQRAALKSNFALTLNPLDYSNSRRFDTRFSQWYTNENLTTSGTFKIQQPILYTDGTISLTNQTGWQNSSSVVNGVTSNNKAYFNNLNLALTQPLFTYNRTLTQIKTLEYNNENAMLNYAIQRLSLEKNVSQFFYSVYTAQMSLTIKTEELANTEKSNEIIKNKVEAGLAAKEELYQSEVNLATAQSAVQQGRVSLENAKDQFKQFIGMDITTEMTVITDIVVNPMEIDSKMATDHGLASRMELRQRKINIETSQFDMLPIKASNEFRGDLTLSVGLSGDNAELSKVLDKPTNSPRVGISFNVPLWDWGERKAKIRAQEAVINTQKLNYASQEIQIRMDIRQSIRNLSNLKNQIGIALQNQKNAQLTYDINLERYKNGDLTSMDLNLYQTQLSNSKMSYAQALINYKMELLNLKIVSLYDFTTNEPVIPEKFIKEYQTSTLKK